MAMKLKALTIMLAVVLLAPTLSFGMASFDFPVVSPVVTFVAGDVTIKGTGATDWDPAEVGRLLVSGDSIRTGPASKAEISCATGKMRLYENTVIIVPEIVDEGDKTDVRAVTLEDGAGLFRIKKRGVERGFEVKTSNIIAGVKGTLFAVLHQKAKRFSRVAVYSGVVLVTDLMRNPDTAAELNKGKGIDVLQDKFGDIYTLIFWDTWGHWKKEPNPSPEFLSRTVPSGSYQWIEEDEGDDEDDEDCPPVVDNDGNVIIQ